MESQLETLRNLERESECLRRELGIPRPGEIDFQAPRSMWSDKDVVVEADGVGGAKLLIVEGNYPIDYTTWREQRFSSEDEACEAADALAR